MTMYIASATKHSNKQGPHLLEPYAHLYVGDYFADTLNLTANQHRALRLLLLESWVRGFVANARLPTVARVDKNECKAIKPVVLPLLANVRSRISQCRKKL